MYAVASYCAIIIGFPLLCVVKINCYVEKGESFLLFLSFWMRKNIHEGESRISVMQKNTQKKLCYHVQVYFKNKKH